MVWKLPIGEAKEILAKIACKTKQSLENLELSKRIIERLEDDPRRKFKIDFNKFMEEPDVLPP